MTLRRLLLVSPGHKWSTWDCFTGLGRGFDAAGVDCHAYALEERVPKARDWLAWDEGEEAAADAERVIFLAGQESVIKALAIAADAVVVVTGLLFDPRFYIMLARARIPVFLFGTESPYNDPFYHQCIPMVAAASTNDAGSVADWRAAVSARGSDTRVLHLPLGFDPKVHHPGMGEDLDAPAADVVFVGNMYPTRAEILSAVDWTGIDLQLFGVFEMVADQPDWPLWPYVYGATPANPSVVIDNRLTAAVYRRSKIVLNLFRREMIGKAWHDVTYLEGDAAGTSINPRMIEAAAMGCFMISEWRPEVESTFGPTVPTFRTPAELEALVRYYLAHEDERLALAAQLPAKVAAFSYHARSLSILETMGEIRDQMRATA